QIASAYPNSYTAPLAMLSQVYILKAKNRNDDARRICETILTQYRTSFWAGEAMQQLRLLKPITTSTPPPKAVPTVPPMLSIPAAPAPPAPPAGLPGFFSLFHARIATQQALGLEWASQICVNLKKRARDRELRRAGLTHNAAATGMNKQVVSVNSLRILQRLQHHILQRHSREIIFEGPA